MKKLQSSILFHRIEAGASLAGIEVMMAYDQGAGVTLVIVFVSFLVVA